MDDVTVTFSGEQLAAITAKLCELAGVHPRPFESVEQAIEMLQTGLDAKKQAVARMREAQDKVLDGIGAATDSSGTGTVHASGSVGVIGDTLTQAQVLAVNQVFSNVPAMALVRHRVTTPQDVLENVVSMGDTLGKAIRETETLKENAARTDADLKAAGRLIARMGIV